MTPATISTTTDLGLVCRHARSSGFKLAIVVGYPRDPHSNKLRVCVWRAASKRWTDPHLVERDALVMLVEADHMKHRRVIEVAAQAALDLKLVGRVWS